MTTAEATTLAIDALETIGLPVWQEERGAESAKYIVLSNIYNGENQFANDQANGEHHHFFIHCFVERRFIDLMNGYMEDIKAAMKTAGFLLEAGGHNLPVVSDAGSKYYGRYSEFKLEY